MVITGLGLVTPLGNDVKTSWDAILEGRSGIASIEDFDVPGPDISEYRVRFAGRIKNFKASDYMPARDVKKFDPFIHYGVAAAGEALRDAGLEGDSRYAGRTGVAISSGIGGLTTLEGTRHIIDTKGLKRVSPFCIPATIVNMLSGQVSIQYGLKGPNVPIITACTTGTHNIGNAARMIAYGDADIMLAGGAEKASTAIGLSGFAAAKALSTRNDAPEKASRPWDKGRDGFVLGDGAGVMVVEEYEQAKARGATIYAEVTGFGMSADAFHITMPSVEGQRQSMVNALDDAGIDPGEIDYVNAHGTSTPAGDVQESQCVENLVGSRNGEVVMSSTKSMTGHLLGAAGAIEAIFCALAIRDQVAPPTINLDDLEEGCHLDYAANAAKPMQIDYTMKNSFGFGGTNGTLVFKRL